MKTSNFSDASGIGSGRNGSQQFSHNHPFKPSSPIHIYQRSYDWGIVFYDDVFILAHFTLICTLARKYGVKLLAVSYMLNHYHQLSCFGTREAMTKFMVELTSKFSREYNDYMDRSGALFAPDYGASVKTGSKKIVSSFNYVVNNPVEKGLVGRAIDYRWNFLRYSMCEFPLSEPIKARTSSRKLWTMARQVRMLRKDDKPLSIRLLVAFKSKLSQQEWVRLVDLIIIEYNAIDYESMAGYFRSKKEMLSSPDYNTGSEYDIKEESMPHKPYYRMLNRVKQDMPLYQWNPWQLDEDEIQIWVKRLIDGSFSPEHIKGFLHRF